MKKLSAVLAAACTGLVLAAAAAASPVIGVAEDATKYAPDGGASIYAQMKSYGLTSNRISVFWNHTNPTSIPEKSYLDKVVPAAKAAGVQLVFAIYADPRVSGAAAAISSGGADAYCNYAATIARTYPSVTRIIIGNEPNQPRFWGPQFLAGAPMSGKQFEPVLAACYDALKAVNPSIKVTGVGLSPRGNDNASASSNVSTSPVRFLREFAAAYRASGRTKPIMDEFGFHCYPNVNTDSLQKGYQWPNVGCANLDRLKQALWDGFNGTAQSTPLEAGLSSKAAQASLPIVLDETGWQVGVAGAAGYKGRENVPTIDEQTQASIYSGLVNIAACDPAVAALHFLYLSDSPALEDFQSGILRVDGSARPAADSVASAIARGCSGRETSWAHTTSVVNASAKRAIVNTRKAVVLTAQEDYAYSVVITKGRKKATASGKGKAYLTVSSVVPAGFKGGIAKVTLSAWANPDRTSTFIVPLG